MLPAPRASDGAVPWAGLPPILKDILNFNAVVTSFRKSSFVLLLPLILPPVLQLSECPPRQPGMEWGDRGDIRGGTERAPYWPSQGGQHRLVMSLSPFCK